MFEPEPKPITIAIPDAIHRLGDPKTSFTLGIEEGELLGGASPRQASDPYANESDGTYGRWSLVN